MQRILPTGRIFCTDCQNFITNPLSFQKVKQSIKLSLCNFLKSQAVILFNTIDSGTKKQVIYFQFFFYHFIVYSHWTFFSFYDVLWWNVCKGKNLISAAFIPFDRNDKISDNPTLWEFEIFQMLLSDSSTRTKVLSFSPFWLRQELKKC